MRGERVDYFRHVLRLQSRKTADPWAGRLTGCFVKLFIYFSRKKGWIRYLVFFPAPQRMIDPSSTRAFKSATAVAWEYAVRLS